MDAAHRGCSATAPVQRKEETAGAAAQPPITSGGGGQSLPEPVQAKMEQTFGADFSAVRVHQGPYVQALGALAYTKGNDVHFAPGQYDPGSQSGQELLGHELTHVVQQSQGRVRATTQAKGVGVNDDAGLEREADTMGARAARGEAGSGMSLRPRGQGSPRPVNLNKRLAAPARQAVSAPVRSDSDGLTVTPPSPTSGGALHIAHSQGIGIRHGDPIQFQLTVTHEDNGNWTIEGRPAFKSFVRKSLCEKWNEENPEKEYDYKEINLSEEELDQCHVTAWAIIRDEMVQAYLNGDIGRVDFLKRTNALYGEAAPSDYTKMCQYRDKVVSAKDSGGAPSSDDVKQLCSYLNSATPNLRLDDHKYNIKIKEHSDPHLVNNTGGISMTPKSKVNTKENMKLQPPRLSEGGTSFLTSSLGGTRVKLEQMTPNTKTIYKGTVSENEPQTKQDPGVGGPYTLEDLQDSTRFDSENRIVQDMCKRLSDSKKMSKGTSAENDIPCFENGKLIWLVPKVD